MERLYGIDAHGVRRVCAKKGLRNPAIRIAGSVNGSTRERSEYGR